MLTLWTCPDWSASASGDNRTMMGKVHGIFLKEILFRDISMGYLWYHIFVTEFFPSPIYLLVFLLQGPRYQIYFSHKFSILFDRFIQLNTKLLLSTCNVQFFNAQSSFLTQLMPIKH